MKHDHHHLAAQHLQAAARHHELANTLHQSGKHDDSAHQAHMAYGHVMHAIKHQEQAAQLYAEQHSPDHPKHLSHP